MNCSCRGPMQPVLERVRAGEEDRPARCGGILKSATISFGQTLAPKSSTRMRAAGEADLVLAIGTTFRCIPSPALFPRKAAGARVVIVNAEPTPFDAMADAVIQQRIGEVLPAICS